MKNSCNLHQPAFPSHLCLISLISSSILPVFIHLTSPSAKKKKKLHRNAFILSEEKVRLVFFVVRWLSPGAGRVRNMFVMIWTLWSLCPQNKPAPLCVSVQLLPLLVLKKTLPAPNHTKRLSKQQVIPQLDREDNLYYDDDEKIQWKARSVSIPPNKI